MTGESRVITEGVSELGTTQIHMGSKVVDKQGAET